MHEARTVLWGPQIPLSTLMSLFAIPNVTIFQTPYQLNSVFRSLTFDLPIDRFAIIPNGFEPYDDPMIEEKVDRFKVSWLGNVIPRKRPNDFVNAIIKLQNLLPVQAQLIGSLNDTESLGQDFMSFARNPPEFISFLGELPRPHALYIVKNSDIYCHTSSFALAPLEAAALGVPVILAALPVHQFIGWRHQENCLLYPPDDEAV